MALIDSIEAYWKLEDTADDVASYTLTNTGTTTFTSAKILAGGTFNGTNQGLNNASVIGGTSYPRSYAGWVKFDTLARENTIFSLSDGSIHYYNLKARASDDNIVFRSNNNTEAADVDTGITAVADTWYHVAVVQHSSTSVSLYVDGTKTNTEATTFVATVNDFWLGYLGRSSVWWLDGQIDEVGFWDKALSDDEVTELYNSGAGLQYPFPAKVSTITIQNSKVAADLTDYPVYVDLADMSTDFWSTVADGGGDIRLYKDNANAGVNTKSLDLEASSSQTATITNAAQTGLGITTDFTLECWIKLESQGTAYLITKKNTAGYQFFIHSTNALQVNYRDTTTNTVIRCDTVFGTEVVGVWMHVAVAVDVSARTAVFYVDGVAQESTVVTAGDTSISNGTDPFEIGSKASGSYFDGKIADVRVWSDIRTATEISEYYNQQLVGTETNLEGYWKFDNDYLDETSNNNDLTASGSPVFATDAPYTIPGELPREVVACETTGDTGELHFKYTGTLSGSANTVVNVYTDGTSADYAVTDPYGAEAVWTDYAYVGHFQTDDTDSSGNLTPTNSGDTYVTGGKVGDKALHFAGSNTTQNITLNMTGRTVTGYVQDTGDNSENGYFVDARTGLSNGYLYYNEPDDTLSFGAGWSSVYLDASAATTNVTTLATATWGHLTLKSSAQWTDTDFKIGMRYTGPVAADAWDGLIDEFRVTTTADLSTDWITTEYNNQSSPSTFYTAANLGGAADNALAMANF